MVILLALYLKPILKLPKGFKYGYVDDITTLNIGQILVKTIQVTYEDNVLIKVAGTQIDITFNTTKIKVIYFTRA